MQSYHGNRPQWEWLVLCLLHTETLCSSAGNTEALLRFLCVSVGHGIFRVSGFDSSIVSVSILRLPLGNSWELIQKGNCVTFETIFFSAAQLLSVLSFPYLIGQGGLSETHQIGRYLWLHTKVSVSSSILFCLQSQQTLSDASFLPGVSMTTFFQLPAHSVWTFLSFPSPQGLTTLWRFAAAVFRIVFGLFWKLAICISLSCIHLVLLCTLFCVCCPSPLPFTDDAVFVALFSLTLMSAPPPLCRFCSFPALSFTVQVCLCARALAYPRVRIRGECESEWHAAGTQQESILPTSYLPLSQTRRQDKRGEEGRLSVSVWGCQSMWTSGVEKLK